MSGLHQSSTTAARRHQRRKPGEPFSLGQLRAREIILKVVNHIFGETLPDDDYGRDVLFEVLNQLALSGIAPDQLREHGLDLLPEVGDDDTLYDMVQAIGPGRKRTADDIARRLGVDYQLRTLLDLRTIGACDMSKSQRKAIAAQKEAADKRWKREKAGSKPRAQSAARKKPWEDKGISRTKYYELERAKKVAAAASNDAPGLVRRSYSSLISLPKQSTPETEPPTVPKTPTRCQAPSSFDQPEPEAVMSELPATCGAVLSGRDLEYAARLRLLEITGALVRSPDPERWQPLLIEATGAWARSKAAVDTTTTTHRS